MIEKRLMVLRHVEVSAWLGPVGNLILIVRAGRVAWDGFCAGWVGLAGLLGGLLARKISHQVDCIVPVPLSSARLRERGYNQSVEIARRLGAKLDLALCVRERDTPAQMDLPYEERRRNVRGAFRCTRALLGSSVAVVDDVMTTGETLNEIASVLKKAGAARVVNWVVVRTLPT